MKKNIAVRLLLICSAVFLIAAASPTVSNAGDAVITITPSAEKPAGVLTIEGAGFKPDETVDLTLDLGDGLLVGLGTTKVEEIRTDSSGAFSVPTGVPRVAKPGTYSVDAEGDKGSTARAELVVK